MITEAEIARRRLVTRERERELTSDVNFLMYYVVPELQIAAKDLLRTGTNPFIWIVDPKTTSHEAAWVCLGWDFKTERFPRFKAPIWKPDAKRSISWKESYLSVLHLPDAPIPFLSNGSDEITLISPAEEISEMTRTVIANPVIRDTKYLDGSGRPLIYPDEDPRRRYREKGLKRIRF